MTQDIDASGGLAHAGTWEPRRESEPDAVYQQNLARRAAQCKRICFRRAAGANRLVGAACRPADAGRLPARSAAKSQGLAKTLSSSLSTGLKSLISMSRNFLPSRRILIFLGRLMPSTSW